MSTIWTTFFLYDPLHSSKQSEIYKPLFNQELRYKVTLRSLQFGSAYNKDFMFEEIHPYYFPKFNFRNTFSSKILNIKI